MNGNLSLDKRGALALEGDSLQDGEPLEVWVEGKWFRSRVARTGRNWLVLLDDGRVSGGLGLRARRPLRVSQPSASVLSKAVGSPS